MPEVIFEALSRENPAVSIIPSCIFKFKSSSSFLFLKYIPTVLNSSRFFFRIYKIEFILPILSSNCS